MSPPRPDGVDRATVRELVRRGHAFERDGVLFATEAIDIAAASLAAGLLAAEPDGFTLAELRDATGCDPQVRRPLATELDQRGITRRRGDLRIAGPRLPPL